MAEEIEESKTDDVASNETPTDDLTALRTELQQYKSKENTWSAEKQTLENRLRDREDQYRRDFGRQGQQLGDRIKTLEQTLANAIQPKAEQPNRKRSRFDENLVVPDPVTDPENFKRFQSNLIGTLNELQEQNERLVAGGQNNEVEKRLQGKIEALEYQLYLNKEESKLRTEYQFDDADLSRVHDFMKDSNIYDPEAAAIKIPELKRKMFGAMQPKQRDEDMDVAPRREPEKRKSSPKFDPVKAGEEMLKTKSDRVPNGGGKNSADSELNWLAEGKAAVQDGSFRNWPEAKRAEYEQKLMQTLTASNNGSY